MDMVETVEMEAEMGDMVGVDISWAPCKKALHSEVHSLGWRLHAIFCTVPVIYNDRRYQTRLQPCGACIVYL